MELALREALKGGKAVFPNPMVGAVILNRRGMWCPRDIIPAAEPPTPNGRPFPGRGMSRDAPW